MPWDLSEASDGTAVGIMPLPSGRFVRGRGLRHALPAGQEPEFGVYLLGTDPGSFPWESRWVRWPDFWLPSDRRGFADELREVLRRTESERVELACAGGAGRTGTALACLTVLDGLAGDKAVAYVREHYWRRAVETPWQRRFVTRFR